MATKRGPLKKDLTRDYRKEAPRSGLPRGIAQRGNIRGEKGHLGGGFQEILLREGT